MIVFVKISSGNRAAVNEFIREHWFTTEMIVRGRVVDMTKASGIAAMDDGKIAGLLTYEMSGERCEILSLDSVVSCRGVGTALLERLKEAAREAGCQRIVLITTNDNIEALYFYQRRGFDLAHIFATRWTSRAALSLKYPLSANTEFRCVTRSSSRWRFSTRLESSASSLYAPHRYQPFNLANCSSERILVKIRLSVSPLFACSGALRYASS